MSIAAVLPALSTLGALASLASSAVSSFAGNSSASAAPGLTEGAGSGGFEQMQGILKRQEATQVQTMEMQTQANIQKMLTDTANSIASGHLDSGNKVQNALHKAAQGIQF